MCTFNSYEDEQRARAYARLEFPGTYYLAYRDLPELINKYATGKLALDFGCGAGRSTRFLRKLGFSAVGTDISANMVHLARQMDPEGDYRLIPDDGRLPSDLGSFDLVLSAFTFDNIPTAEKKIRLFNDISRLMNPSGIMINLVSSPEIYLHEWASFSTKDYPENKNAKAGDIVKIIITSIDDSRPVEDIVWPHENYLDVYSRSNLTVVEYRRPLGEDGDGYEWINEKQIAPWVIYVLRKKVIN